MIEESIELKIPFKSLIECIDKLSLEEKIHILMLLEDQVSQIKDDDENHIWQAFGMKSLERIWDNDADAVYDNWKNIYDTPKR